MRPLLFFYVDPVTNKSRNTTKKIKHDYMALPLPRNSGHFKSGHGNYRVVKKLGLQEKRRKERDILVREKCALESEND
jgi:hypothetical protein